MAVCFRHELQQLSELVPSRILFTTLLPVILSLTVLCSTVREVFWDLSTAIESCFYSIEKEKRLINNWSGTLLTGENTDTKNLAKQASKVSFWLLIAGDDALPFARARHLNVIWISPGHSALHSSGVHLCLFLPVAECDLPSWGWIEPPGSGAAPGRPIVVGMAEELSSAYGMQRVVCNRSSCFMRWESCPSSFPRGICFPIKIQFSPSHKQCWFFLMIAASLTWRGRASPLSCCNSGSIKLQWNLCPWSQPIDPGSAAGFACLWGGKHAHCGAGHPRHRLSPALKLGLHRYVTLFSCFELSLLAGRRGLGNKAGILSLPSALKQQAWKLAQFISDLCQALLIENNSWIEGSSCYINSGEGGETNVFAGGERHTGSRLVLKLLLAVTFCFFMRWVRGENHFSAWTSGCGCYCFWGLVPQLQSHWLCVNAVTSVKSLWLYYWECEPGIYLLRWLHGQACMGFRASCPMLPQIFFPSYFCIAETSLTWTQSRVLRD